jgi:hypothetical protein
VWEPSEAARFKRDVAAIGRKVDDPAALAQAWSLVGQLKEHLAAAAQRLYDEGYSYADLGNELGTTRQNIAKRWPQSEG